MKMVALLRGINVAGTRKVPMEELRKLTEKTGFTEVQTFIQSGNLVFDSGRKSSEQAAMALEKAILDCFGFEVPVVARTGIQWKKYLASNPFRPASKQRPALVLLGLCRGKCSKHAAS